jgi:hypothetical protein
MKETSSFRGITRDQRELIAYWHSRKGPDGLVRRAVIDPGAFRRMLASISIVAFDDTSQGRFRIAGSALRDVFGMDVRGRRVDEIAGAHGETYALGLLAALERRQPVGGVIDTGGRAHSWLRLPLAGEDGQASQVLCHDQIFTSREALLIASGAGPEAPVPVSSPRFAA